MKVVLATRLPIEECTQRLTNAIDPIPSVQERIDKAPNTSFSPDPLPDAGDRVTGFGYSPGTRPVVGAINNNVFHLEKRAVEIDARTSNVRIKKITQCDGRLQEAPYGTLVELEMEYPNSINLIFLTGLFAVLFGLVCFSLLYTYFTGVHTATPTSKGGGFGWCLGVLIFAAPLVISLIAQQTGKAEEEYLLQFVKQVCRASKLGALEAGKGYTGKTQHLG